MMQCFIKSTFASLSHLKLKFASYSFHLINGYIFFFLIRADYAVTSVFNVLFHVQLVADLV